MKTSTQYQLQQKKSKLYVPNIKKLNINFYSDVSEKAKVQEQPDDRKSAQILSHKHHYQSLKCYLYYYIAPNVN